MANTRKSPRSSALLAQVSAVLQRQVRRGERLVVGLSGGIDSVVLLDLLARLARRRGIALAALHVNHGLNPAAASWAVFCRRLCRRLGVPLSVRAVTVARGDSLEAAARAARYAAYAATRADAVVLAHTLDDQAETVLLQLLRGAGVQGAAAMPEFRAGPPAILRPLLGAPRSAVDAYARARRLEWIEDDSNADTAFDRNFLRHRVLPLIAERYPGYRQTLARASRHFAEAAELVAACAAGDAPIIDGTLEIASLRSLPPARMKNVLRHFLASHGARAPNAQRLAEWVRQLQSARRGARFVFRCDGVELRVRNGRLQCLGAAPASPPVGALVWRGECRWRLTAPAGTLTMTRRRGEGIGEARLAGRALELRARSGGERLRLAAGRPSRTLKNLWQERKVPEWQRPGLPLLFAGDALAWVAGVGVDAAFQAGPGEWGVVPEWRPADA